MVVLTDQDRLIWRELRTRAGAGSVAAASHACVQYGELGMLVDPNGTWHYPMSRPPFRGLNDALGRVSQYEFEHNRPLLSSLVVTVDTGQPGAGFSQFAAKLGVTIDDPETFWQRELARTIAFWSCSEVILDIDAQLDALRARLDKLDQAVNEGTFTKPH